jgi:hypothetical protein
MPMIRFTHKKMRSRRPIGRENREAPSQIPWEKEVVCTTSFDEKNEDVGITVGQSYAGTTCVHLTMQMATDAFMVSNHPQCFLFRNKSQLDLSVAITEKRSDLESGNDWRSSKSCQRRNSPPQSSRRPARALRKCDWFDDPAERTSAPSCTGHFWALVRRRRDCPIICDSQ